MPENVGLSRQVVSYGSGLSRQVSLYLECACSIIRHGARCSRYMRLFSSGYSDSLSLMSLVILSLIYQVA